MRLLVDTGHVADWGGDPCELLEFADHVQLRQGKRGHTQVHVDDPTGVVDFAAVLRRLDTLDYQGTALGRVLRPARQRLAARRPRALGPRSRRARARADALTRYDSPGHVGSGRPGVGMPSNATTRPGSASVDEQRAQVVAAEAAVGGEALAVDREEVDDRAVGIDDADAVLDRRRDVEATVGVEAEAVAAAGPERLDDPLAAPVGGTRVAARAASTTTTVPSGSNAMPLQ